MKEDNWSKKLAEFLRKQQEENPLPYDPGAWESFEEHRKKSKRFSTRSFWTAGIAASLVLMGVLGKFIFPSSFELETPSQLSEQIKIDPSPPSASDPEEVFGAELRKKDQANSSRQETSAEFQTLRHESRAKVGENESWKSGSNSNLSQAPAFSQPMPTDNPSKVNPPQLALEEEKTAQTERKEGNGLVQMASPLLSEEEAKEKLMAQIGEVEPEEKVPARNSSFSVGFGPGYGSTIQNSMATSGSNLGLGVMYDLSVGEKLSLGSGLGVNYYHQTSKSQQYAQVAGLSSPVEEAKRVEQMQLDIPVYVRYPLTKNNSVSLQAGFSNLITFSQQAIQTVSFTRQVYVADVVNSIANASTLKTEQVSQTSELNVARNKIYPFALANLGVNILVYKTQKTNFLVMPFYHYPLRDISGTGQNPGVTGAAFKVNFGAIRK
jgi:hypothetical protein